MNKVEIYKPQRDMRIVLLHDKKKKLESEGKAREAEAVGEEIEYRLKLKGKL